MVRIRDPDPSWIWIQSGQWIRIRIQEDKKDPQKQNKIKKCQVFKYWMFSFEG